MERFRVLLCKHNAEIYLTSRAAFRSELIIALGLARISLFRWLDPRERNESIAIQLGHLELGHPWPEYRELPNRWFRSFWDREAVRWAARYLIPDRILEEARRGEWLEWQIAEACDVTSALVRVRMEDFMRRAG